MIYNSDFVHQHITKRGYYSILKRKLNVVDEALEKLNEYEFDALIIMKPLVLF